MGPAKTTLIDLSVLRRGVFTQETHIQRKITWANREFLVETAEWEPKPLPEDLWLRRQVDCLPTIVRLAREGRIVLSSYSELDFEEMRASRGMAGTFGDLFSGVEIKKCQPAANRSRFRKNIDFGYYLKKEELLEFCDFLLQLPESLLQQTPEIWATLPTSEQENLLQISLFKLLSLHLARTHYPDAFHLWTAEINGLDYFLMMDKKFPNALQNRRDLDLHCRVVSPDDLLKALEISERDPYPDDNRPPRNA
jgi:hypothetical protein